MFCPRRTQRPNACVAPFPVVSPVAATQLADCISTGTIPRIAANVNCSWATVSAGAPYGVAVTPSGLVLTADNYGSTVCAVSMRTGGVANCQWATGLNSPTDIAVDPRSGMVYVVSVRSTDASDTTSTVCQVHPNGGPANCNWIPFSGDGSIPNAQGVAVHPTTGAVYISTSLPTGSGACTCGICGAVCAVASTGGKAQCNWAQSPDFCSPQGLAVDPRSGNLYVANEGIGINAGTPGLSQPNTWAICLVTVTSGATSTNCSWATGFSTYQPRELAVSNNTGTVYVIGQNSGSANGLPLCAVSPTGGNASRSCDFWANAGASDSLEGVVVHPRTDTIYVSYGAAVNSICAVYRQNLFSQCAEGFYGQFGELSTCNQACTLGHFCPAGT
jgi:DNA-binding beta-propeller fold protein YncE